MGPKSKIWRVVCLRMIGTNKVANCILTPSLSCYQLMQKNLLQGPVTAKFSRLSVNPNQEDPNLVEIREWPPLSPQQPFSSYIVVCCTTRNNSLYVDHLEYIQQGKFKRCGVFSQKRVQNQNVIDQILYKHKSEEIQWFTFYFLWLYFYIYYFMYIFFYCQGFLNNKN